MSEVRFLSGKLGRWCNGSSVASKPTGQGSIPWRPVKFEKQYFGGIKMKLITIVAISVAVGLALFLILPTDEGMKKQNNWIPVGTVVKVQYFRGSFGYQPQTQIITTSNQFMVWGPISSVNYESQVYVNYRTSRLKIYASDNLYRQYKLCK